MNQAVISVLPATRCRGSEGQQLTHRKALQHPCRTRTDVLHVPAATDLEGLEGPQHVQGVRNLPVLGTLSLCNFGCTLGLPSTLPFLATPAQGVPKVLVLICARQYSSSAVGLEQCGH